MIVSLGSINADFVVRAAAPPSGPGAQLVDDLLRTSGGKAANVAVLVAGLGAPATLLGAVGDDDLADQALAGPRAAGVDLTGIRRCAGATGYSSVVVPPDGAKAIFLALGANDAWAGAEADVAASVEGSGARVVVVDLEVPPSIVRAALEAARRAGAVTVVDPAPPDRCDDEVLALADHVTPDHTEATEITGIDADDEGGALAAADALRARGAVTAYVKLRDGGCAVAGPDGRFVVDPPEVEVVDATGAGDAFAAGLAWALWRGRSGEAAARVAVAAASVAVGRYGSQESYPTLAQLEDRTAAVPPARRVGEG